MASKSYFLIVDGAGFEPATSAKFADVNLAELTDNEIDRILSKFGEWLEVDELRKPRTIQHHTRWIRKLLIAFRKCPLNKDDYRLFLKKWKGRAGVYHYSNLVKAVRVFTRYLGCEQIGKSFRFPRISRLIMIAKKREDLQKFYYEGLERLDDRAFFLITATSGLRGHEVRNLALNDIDLETCMVIPNNGEATLGGTKNTYVTFINSEARAVLKQFIAIREIREQNTIFSKGFGKSAITYRWHKASKKCGVKLRPSDLRDWFCSELGEHGVADRYIDAFCGRVPKSVLARHYTDYSPEKLKRIYDKANIKVLN